jgi:biotin synthase-related radical SAM superfamily protein
LRELEAGEIGEEVVDIGLIVDEGEEDAGIVEYVCGFARPPFE